MNNNKGQSLVDMIFSIGIVVLVLTGVVVLVVSTAKVKRLTFERQKAIELSQKAIEVEVKKTKDIPPTFWSLSKNGVSSSENLYDYNFPKYTYKMNYNCTIIGNPSDKCDVTFIVNWGVGQSLSVKRFFSRQGI